MKIIITESHYKLLLENLIDEAVPSEHFKGRNFGRILNREFFEVGYDEGDYNYVTVGKVKKDNVVRADYDSIVNLFDNFDLPTPYMGSLGRHMELPKTYKNYEKWIENENEIIKKNIISLYELVKENKLSENKFNSEVRTMLDKSYGVKIENLRIPIKDIEISEDYIEYYKEYELSYDLESEIRKQMKNELPKDLKGIKLNDDRVNERVNTELKRLIKDFLYSKVNNGQLLVLDNENKTYGNQTYLVIRNNVLVTIFLGIGYAFRNPIKKLEVDYYFNSVESFIEYYNQNF